jgi:hypothetical protein
VDGLSELRQQRRQMTGNRTLKAVDRIDRHRFGTVDSGPKGSRRSRNATLREVGEGSGEMKKARNEAAVARGVESTGCHQMDMARLLGSRLLLDETVRTGLVFTTKCESEGTQTSKHEFSIYTHVSVSTRSHDR